MPRQRIPEYVEKRIAVEATLAQNRDKPFKEIYELLRLWLRRFGREGDLPSLRKVQQVGGDARRAAAGQRWKEDPFSLGALVENGAPFRAEDVVFLIRLARWAHIYAEPLSNRDAMWAARIRDAIRYYSYGELDRGPAPGNADRPAAELYHWARLYSAEEQSAELLDRPLDTRELDFRLCGDGEEWITGEYLCELGAWPATPASRALEAAERAEDKKVLARAPLDEDTARALAAINAAGLWVEDDGQGQPYAWDFSIDLPHAAELLVAMRLVVKRLEWENLEPSERTRIVRRVYQLIDHPSQAAMNPDVQEDATVYTEEFWANYTGFGSRVREVYGKEDWVGQVVREWTTAEMPAVDGDSAREGTESRSPGRS